MRLDPTATLSYQLRAAQISFTTEFLFAKPERRWRADFALPAEKPVVLVEIEGGVWNQGRHTRGQGFSNDIEKYNAATLRGYKVFRFTTSMIADGRAIATIQQALKTM